MRIQHTLDGAVVNGSDFSYGYHSLGQVTAHTARRMVLVGKIMDIRIAVSEYDRMLVVDDPSDYSCEEDMPRGNGDGTRFVRLSDGHLWVFCEGGIDLHDFWTRVRGE